MMNVTSKKFALAVCLAVILDFALSPAAFAALVPQGGVIPVSGTTAAIDPTLTGPILYNKVSLFDIPMAAGGSITGSFQDSVVRNTLGTLDFYARIFNVQSSVSGATVSAFLRGYLTNYPGPCCLAYMDYRTEGLVSVAPQYAVRSVDSSGAGFYFDFVNGVGAGQSSYPMFYRTTATAFNVLGTGYVAHYDSIGSSYDYSNTLTLAQPVPEPETYAMLLAGLGLVGFTTLRRKQNFTV
jgi:hypothetical protein